MRPASWPLIRIMPTSRANHVTIKQSYDNRVMLTAKAPPSVSHYDSLQTAKNTSTPMSGCSAETLLL